MKMSRRLSVTLALILYGTVFGNALARDGSETHSGQGRRDRNGPIVLTDFGGYKVSLVIDNLAWAKTIPDLIPLIDEIFEASPDMGALIWGQLGAVKIMTTRSALVLASPQVNTLLKTDESNLPNLQAGYREADDILFTESALIEQPDDSSREGRRSQGFPPSYNVLHELLHGLIPGSKAFHQMKVGGLNDFFRTHRGAYTKGKIVAAAVAAGFTVPAILDNPFSRDAFELLIHERGNLEARCWILRGNWVDRSKPEWVRILGDFGQFREAFQRLAYSSCVERYPDSDVENATPEIIRRYFFRQHPDLGALEDQQRPSALVAASLNHESAGLREDRRRGLAKLCDSNADALIAKLEAAVESWEHALSEFRNISSSGPTDPAEEFLQKLMLDHGNGLSLEIFQASVDSAKKDLDRRKQNRETCRRLFPN